MRKVLFWAALWFSNTLFCHLYSQQTLLLALNTLATVLNYVSLPLGYNLPASPPKVLRRLLKLTNFHGNKVHLQWDHIVSYHSLMVPTQIPAWDCCYLNPDKLAGTQSVKNTNTDPFQEIIQFLCIRPLNMHIQLKVTELRCKSSHSWLNQWIGEWLKKDHNSDAYSISYTRLHNAV